MPALLLQATPNPLAQLGGTLVPMVLLLVAAWFLLFRPMQAQRKEQEAMRSGLKPGDEVLTTGGLYGVVTRLRDDRVHVRIAEGVQVEVARSAVSGVSAPAAKE